MPPTNKMDSKNALFGLEEATTLLYSSTIASPPKIPVSTVSVVQSAKPLVPALLALPALPAEKLITVPAWLAFLIAL